MISLCPLSAIQELRGLGLNNRTSDRFLAHVTAHDQSLMINIYKWLGRVLQILPVLTYVDIGLLPKPT